MELEYLFAIVWDRNKAIGIEEWSICGGGRLGRFHCVYIYIYIYIGHCDRISGVRASDVEDRKFGSLSSQTNNL